MAQQNPVGWVWPGVCHEPYGGFSPRFQARWLCPKQLAYTLYKTLHYHGVADLLQGSQEQLSGAPWHLPCIGYVQEQKRAPEASAYSTCEPQA